MKTLIVFLVLCVIYGILKIFHGKEVSKIDEVLYDPKTKSYKNPVYDEFPDLKRREE